MTAWRTLMLVTRREVTERARSRAFQVSTGFTMLLILGVIVVPALLAGRDVTHEIGLVGTGNERIISTAETLANSGDGRTLSFELATFGSETEAGQAVDDGVVDAALVDGKLILVKTAPGFTGSELIQLLQRAAASVRLEGLVADAETSKVLELLTSEPLELRALRGGLREDQETKGIVAYGGLILMYIAVLTYGAWTLTGVTEEKSNRVVEVLLSSMPPRYLLAGKILGIGLLGLAQFVVTITLALVAIELTGTVDIPEVPLASVIVLVIWFVLGFALFSVAFGAAGSLVSRMEDAQNAAAPFSLVAVVGFFVSFHVIDDPTGVVGIVASYLPITAPFVVPVRFALEAIGWGEMLAAIAVSTAAVYGLIRLAGRVYVGGLLRYSGRLSWREAFRSAEE